MYTVYCKSQEVEYVQILAGLLHPHPKDKHARGHPILSHQLQQIAPLFDPLLQVLDCKMFQD